jgi:prevent-host-death family protein
MRTITAGQLRARLGEALDEASAGERIVIERDHVPIAAVVPIEDVHRLEDQTEEALLRKREAMARLTAFGKLMNERHPPPDDGFPDDAAWLRWDRDHGHEDGV